MILLFSSFLKVSAQPEYYFTKHQLESGTDLKVGAVYRFFDVKPGFDALVTITTLNKITLDELDGASGFDEAFQPYIHCPGKTKGYVEFRIDFVKAGTNTPAVMLEVPMTAIDIDGYEFPDEKLYEFDEFEKSAAFYVDYDLLGSNLNVNTGGPWVQAINNSAVTYDGIDTIQRDVMITMVHANISTVKLRVGVDNKSKTNMQRLRSVYFKKFRYSNLFLLARSPLTSFSGNSKNNQVTLDWTLTANHSLNNIVIEKADARGDFTPIEEFASKGNTLFTFTDNVPGSVNYYRLKMVSYNGKTEYSNVLMFKTGNAGKQVFKVYPSIIETHTTISLLLDKAENTTLQLVDLSGRIVYQQILKLQSGRNETVINIPASIYPGNYIAVVKTSNELYSQQIIKQ
jgi:hypothetical protein